MILGFATKDFVKPMAKGRQFINSKPQHFKRGIKVNPIPLKHKVWFCAAFCFLLWSKYHFCLGIYIFKFQALMPNSIFWLL